MQGKRLDRVNQLVKEEISTLLQRELKDPRLGFVSVTEVETARDLRTAKVFVSVLGDEAQWTGSLAALAGMLAPEIRETALGKAQVRQIFVISKLGPICGSYVSEGKIVRGAKVRVRRGDEIVGQGTVGSLKRFKDEVREVLAGLECGIGVDGVNGVQPGDILEVYTSEEVARTL